MAAVDRADLREFLDEDAVYESDEDRAARTAGYTTQPTSEIASAIDLARWNVPTTEYGDSTDDEVLALARAASASCLPPTGPLRETYREPMRAWLREKLLSAVKLPDEGAALRALAGLRHFVDLGARLIQGNLPAFYQAAREDLAELDALQLLPPDLHAALVQGASLNDLFYAGSLHFGGECATWQPLESDSDHGILMLPTVLGTACALDDSLWHGLVSAVYADDTENIAKYVRQLQTLSFQIAQRRGTLGVVRRDRATGRNDPTLIEMDADGAPQLETRRAKDLTKILADLFAPLSDDRSLQAARLSLEGYNLAEIGAQLGTGKSQAGELVKRGMKRIREDPRTRDLLTED